MKFVFSRNDQVKNAINPKTGKISAGGNFRVFNENWIAENEDIDTLIRFVCDEQNGLCAWHLIDGKRVDKKTGCVQAGLLQHEGAVDVEGEDAVAGVDVRVGFDAVPLVLCRSAEGEPEAHVAVDVPQVGSAGAAHAEAGNRAAPRHEGEQVEPVIHGGEG